jgi:cytochrome c
MKKIISLSILILAFSCTEKPKEDSKKESNIMLPEPSEIALDAKEVGGKDEGLVLIEGADCLGCHKIDAKLVGPSYQEIADKYTEADLDKLATKIIEGGKGVWGEIPMTPHSGMSKENAQKMVKYILTLKK